MTPAVATIAAHWHDGHWFPWFPLLPLLFVSMWVLLFALAIRRRRPTPGEAAESVLGERYARGEIGEREFQERRAVLRRR